MRPVVLLVVLGLVAAGCRGDDPAATTDVTSSSVTTSTSEPPAPIRLLALGDSYTIGESVDEAERFPVQLGARLEAEGVVSEAEVVIVARTGWTTGELDSGIDATAPEGQFDLVTLLIGVNNQFRGLSLEQYRAEFMGLLEQAIGFAAGDPDRVVVVSIPDWGVTPFGSGYDAARVAEEIDAFNAAAEEVASGRGVAWVDITPISRSGAAGLVAGDGLHPSGEQYRLWVDQIFPVAAAALGSR